MTVGTDIGLLPCPVDTTHPFVFRQPVLLVHQHGLSDCHGDMFDGTYSTGQGADIVLSSFFGASYYIDNVSCYLGFRRPRPMDEGPPRTGTETQTPMEHSSIKLYLYRAYFRNHVLCLGTQRSLLLQRNISDGTIELASHSLAGPRNLCRRMAKFHGPLPTPLVSVPALESPCSTDLGCDVPDFSSDGYRGFDLLCGV